MGWLLFRSPNNRCRLSVVHVLCSEIVKKRQHHFFDAGVFLLTAMALQASDALAVEKQARLRAETKEEDERRERISTTAQTTAVRQQHSKEMEAERLSRIKLETDVSLRSEVGIFFWFYSSFAVGNMKWRT